MRCTPSKSPCLLDGKIVQTKPISRLASKLAAVVFGGVLGLLAPINALAAEFLSPLPIQELKIGETFTLGIRPSRSPARSRLNTKLELFAEGLSAGASFRRIGDEIWEFSWLTTEADQGVHVVRVLVTERDEPSVVIEVEELTFIVGGVPYAVIGSEDKALPEAPANGTLPNETIVVEAATKATSPSESVSPSQTASTAQVAASVQAAQQSQEAGLDWRKELADLVGKPEWRLAPVASQVVTPHQWVRFPVDIISDADDVSDYVVVQIDRLPNGASFDARTNGGRQFQWRPGTSDSGEHLFRITAVDSEDASRRESVTMRIIVQE